MGSYAGTRGFISRHLRVRIGSLRAELLLPTLAHPGARAQDSGAHARICSCPRVRILMPTHGTPEPARGVRHTRATDSRYSRAHLGNPRAQMLLPTRAHPRAHARDSGAREWTSLYPRAGLSMCARGCREPTRAGPHAHASASRAHRQGSGAHVWRSLCARVGLPLPARGWRAPASADPPVRARESERREPSSGCSRERTWDPQRRIFRCRRSGSTPSRADLMRRPVRDDPGRRDTGRNQASSRAIDLR
jgi:hypothetical protein